MTGRRYDGSPDRILTAINKVIAANGWTVVAQKGEPGVDEEILLEVVARTFLLGFTSDAVIRLSDEGETTYVDMRSVSRYGIHDLGENADRIIAFMTALDAEVQTAGRGNDRTGAVGASPLPFLSPCERKRFQHLSFFSQVLAERGFAYSTPSLGF